MKSSPTWFAALSYVMAALLLVCVLLQYNDPDPIRWMVVYGIGALLAALLPSRPATAPIAILGGLVTLGWAGYLVWLVWGKVEVSDLTGKMSEKGGAVEVGREAGGLAIQGAWLVFAGAFRKWRT